MVGLDAIPWATVVQAGTASLIDACPRLMPLIWADPSISLALTFSETPAIVAGALVGVGHVLRRTSRRHSTAAASTRKRKIIGQFGPARSFGEASGGKLDESRMCRPAFCAEYMAMARPSVIDEGSRFACWAVVACGVLKPQSCPTPTPTTVLGSISRPSSHRHSH